MRVLKVVAEGITTSFRYPHFMQGIHPTFDMPPPATIYGHVCSALGEWVPPEGVQFSYHFTFQDAFYDVEHIHLLTGSSGKLPGTDTPKVLEGAVNPFKRQMLFKPRLVLYLNKPEWEGAFLSPHYAVVLGRSQDLFMYTDVRVMELQEADHAYFEHTLAPYSMALQMTRGYVVLMPRFLRYADGRLPTFARYVVLHQRVHSKGLIHFGQTKPTQSYLVDPESPDVDGDHLGLFFHDFVGEYDDQPRLA